MIRLFPGLLAVGGEQIQSVSNKRLVWNESSNCTSRHSPATVFWKNKTTKSVQRLKHKHLPHKPCCCLSEHLHLYFSQQPLPPFTLFPDSTQPDTHQLWNVLSPARCTSTVKVNTVLQNQQWQPKQYRSSLRKYHVSYVTPSSTDKLNGQQMQA